MRGAALFAARPVQAGTASAKLAIQREVTVRGSAPAEVLAHRAPLRRFPFGAPAVERERPANRGGEAARLEVLEDETGGEIFGEIFQRCVHHSVRETADAMHERQRTVGERVKLRQPA